MEPVGQGTEIFGKRKVDSFFKFLFKGTGVCLLSRRLVIYRTHFFLSGVKFIIVFLVGFSFFFFPFALCFVNEEMESAIPGCCLNALFLMVRIRVRFFCCCLVNKLP